MPQRIQQKRAKGWRMPLNAKSVARPSKWGNPWSVVGDTGYTPEGEDFWFPGGHTDAVEWAVQQHREWLAEQLQTNPLIIEALTALRGLDLACYCPLPDPMDADAIDMCHAATLLREANS
jgi:hypothetical protein